MKTLAIFLIFSVACAAKTIVYNTGKDISVIAADIKAEHGINLIKESSTDTVQGHINRKGNTTTIEYYEDISTTKKAAIDDTLGVMGSESGFVRVEAAVGLAVILASIIVFIKTGNWLYLLPILLIGFIVVKNKLTKK